MIYPESACHSKTHKHGAATGGIAKNPCKNTNIESIGDIEHIGIYTKAASVLKLVFSLDVWRFANQIRTFLDRYPSHLKTGEQGAFYRKLNIESIDYIEIIEIYIKAGSVIRTQG